MEQRNSLVTLLEKLRNNSHLGKHKHFAAADRCKRWDEVFSYSIVIINFTIVFAHILLIIEKLHDIRIMIAVGAISFLAAILGIIEIRSNFHKAFEAHRKIGNEYLEVARECEKNIAFFNSAQMTVAELTKAIKEINEKYNQINSLAEGFPTTQSDFDKARKIQDEKKTNR